MVKDIYKVVLIGDGGVGKTCLRNQFIHRKFSNKYKTTIGADFTTREVESNGVKVTLQIWDTAGQERFQSLGVAYYRGADACILVYDVNNYLTFENLSKWKSEFLKFCNTKDGLNFPFILIGNKVDLEHRVISRRQIQTWIDNNSSQTKKIPSFETSAKLGTEVENAFEAIVKLIPNQDEQLVLDNAMASRIKFITDSPYNFDKYNRSSSMYSQPLVTLTPAQLKLQAARDNDNKSKGSNCCT